MFIYSKFSSFGMESPEKLVHLLANEGARALCLIDEFGLGLNAFLQTCKKRNINASIAIPFSSFVEGRNEKVTGYFVISSHADYVLVTKTIQEMKQDFIPIFKHAQLLHWTKQGIYCLIQAGSVYIEYQSNAVLPIAPIAYETQKVKEQAITQQLPVTGVSLEERYFSPESVIFVEGVSKCPKPFLHELKTARKTVDLDRYREKRKQLTL